MSQSATMTQTSAGVAAEKTAAPGPISSSVTPVGVRPQDSMKSNWRYDLPSSQWTIFHWLVEIFRLHPTNYDKVVPIHQKQDKVPAVPDWQIHRFVLFHALVPLVIHQLYTYIFQKNFNAASALLFYSISFDLIGIHQVNVLRRIGLKYGFLDGDKHERDGIPDLRVRQVVISLLSTVTFRMLLTVVLTYNKNKTPLQLNWWALPIELSLYGVVLDFWFYWYHRVMHQFDSLWRLHRTHHLTKHPNTMLTLYADWEQEVFDIVGIPLLACLSLKAMGLPMGFYEWWLCGQYVVHSELTGHSGVRVHSCTPSPISWLLTMLDMELVIEDHDLHHRKGWKKSHNYGKQTRVWDRIFGTCADRIESVADNIDWENKATWPML